MVNLTHQGSYNIRVPFSCFSPQKAKAYNDVLRKFFIVGGTLFYLAEASVVDAYNHLKKTKLYAHKPKVWSKKCYELINGEGSIDALVKAEMIEGEKGELGYSLYADITDVAQQFTKESLAELKRTVLVYTLEHCKRDAAIKAELMYSCILYGAAVSFYDKFMESQKERTGYDFSKELIRFRCEKQYSLWENAVLALCHDVEGSVTKDQGVIRSHNAFFNLITKENWFNQVSKKAMEDNGNFDDVLEVLAENERKEEEEKEREALGLDRLKEKYIVKNGK